MCACARRAQRDVLTTADRARYRPADRIRAAQIRMEATTVDNDYAKRTSEMIAPFSLPENELMRSESGGATGSEPIRSKSVTDVLGMDRGYLVGPPGLEPGTSGL